MDMRDMKIFSCCLITTFIAFVLLTKKAAKGLELYSIVLRAHVIIICCQG